MIDGDHALSVRKQAACLELHRSGLYYRSREKQEEAEIANEILEIWKKHSFYGHRRITVCLQNLGYKINRKRVLRLMREMNIEALYPKKNLSISSQESFG